MKAIKILSTFFAISMIVASCEKDKTELPVEFRFVLLDTLGIEKPVFNQGEIIIFSFQVINKSSADLMLENFFPNNDFFRVYQPNSVEAPIDHGVPYTGFTLPAGYLVPKNDTLNIKYPWNKIKPANANNFILFGDNERADLPKGNFYTKFSQSFKIGEIQTEENYFEIKFTYK